LRMSRPLLDYLQTHELPYIYIPIFLPTFMNWNYETVYSKRDILRVYKRLSGRDVLINAWGFTKTRNDKCVRESVVVDKLVHQFPDVQYVQAYLGLVPPRERKNIIILYDTTKFITFTIGFLQTSMRDLYSDVYKRLKKYECRPPVYPFRVPNSYNPSTGTWSTIIPHSMLGRYMELSRLDRSVESLRDLQLKVVNL